MNGKKALFIGGVRYDITVEPPPGFNIWEDIKMKSRGGAYDFGGSAGRAVQAAKKLGLQAVFLTKSADDDPGVMFRTKMEKAGVELLESYALSAFPAAIVFPSKGKRAALLIDAPEDAEAEWDDFPKDLDLRGYAGVYADGRLPLPSIFYFKEANRLNIPTVLDGCAGRAHTEELLRHSKFAIVSVLLCEERGLSPPQMIEFLKGCGCHVGAVTLGELGVIWYEGDAPAEHLPALVVPRVVNTNGAGDVFHAAFFYSLIMQPWFELRDHLEFARAAASHAIQDMGDARLPTYQNILDAKKLQVSGAKPEWLR